MIRHNLGHSTPHTPRYSTTRDCWIQESIKQIYEAYVITRQNILKTDYCALTLEIFIGWSLGLLLFCVRSIKRYDILINVSV